MIGIRKFSINLTMSRSTLYWINYVIFLLLCQKSLANEMEHFCKVDCASLPSAEGRKQVCGIKRERDGYRVKMFNNECELVKSVCEENTTEVYGITEDYYCKGLDHGKPKNYTDENDTVKNVKNANVDTEITADHDAELQNLTMKLVTAKEDAEIDFRSNLNDAQIDKDNIYSNISKIVRVDLELDNLEYINETIDDFFNSTHINGFIYEPISNQTRRFGKMFKKLPHNLFEYLREIPAPEVQKTVNNNTIRSCFHVCPMECPDEYKPVCGIPGTYPTEPFLIFKNHCFMDMAQCRVFDEATSWKSRVAAYTEMGFVFCLGDGQDTVYRFLPLMRTLQKMKRGKKGVFKYKVRNWKHWNEWLPADYKPMG